LNQSLLDNLKAKTSYQQTQAEEAASLAEEEAYAPYTVKQLLASQMMLLPVQDLVAPALIIM